MSRLDPTTAAMVFGTAPVSSPTIRFSSGMDSTRHQARGCYVLLSPWLRTCEEVLDSGLLAGSRNFMKSIVAKNLIWILLASAVLVDCLFDVVAFHQAKTTAHAGTLVTEQYEIIRDFDRTILATREMQLLLENQNNRGASTALHTLEWQILRLSQVTLGTPSIASMMQGIRAQFQLLRNATGVSNASILASELLRGLREARDSEEQTLKTQLSEFERQSNLGRQEIMSASAVDLLLLLMIALIWLLSYRRQIRIESALNQSVQSLSLANRDLDHLNRAKTNLLQITAHDLKNPLGSIIGYAELIAEESNKQSVVAMSEIIQKVSEQILTLINSLIQPESISSGNVDRCEARIQVSHTLDEVCNALKPMALKKGQVLHVDYQESALEIWGSSAKLTDLFMNIVGNAIKFSPAGGQIYIRCWGDNDFATVEIEDEGPGFSVEDKQNAFQHGRRLSAHPTGGESSTGLGLASAKEVVIQHKGRIEILDRPQGSGARLRVHLPKVPTTPHLANHNRYSN